jgi:rhodanese-related sulfurtransferase
VCRAGSRSAQATEILREAGFGDIANLAGPLGELLERVSLQATV